MSIDINSLSLEQVLPHRAPMILLDELAHFADEECTAIVNVSPESPFYDADKAAVPSWVGVEYMAQAVAAYAGVCEVQKGLPIRIGFLLGARKYKPARHFALGQTLKIHVQSLYQSDDGLAQFECSIADDAGVIVSAKLNTFCPPDPSEFLQEQ